MSTLVSFADFPRMKLLPEYSLKQVINLMQKARQAGEDIIDFGMGNPDGATPAHIVAKLHEEIENPRNHRYSVSKGIASLREAICAWYARRYSVTLAPDSEAVVSIGAKEGLAHLMLAVLDQGQSVLVPSPSYPIHLFAPIIAGGRIVPVKLLPGEDFLANLEAALRSEKKAGNAPPRFLMLSFPHNPTAEIVDLDFFRKVITLARDYRLLVIHDLAYADLGFDGYQPPSILQVPGAKEIAVEVFSLSKSYNMAGWRVGFVVGNPALVRALEHIKGYLDYGLFQPLQIAAATALNGPDDCVHEIAQVYYNRREVLCDSFAAAGWNIPRPKATMFAWAPIPESHRHMNALTFAKFLLERAKVTVSPGSGFGEYGEGFVRFALIENEARIQEAAERVRAALRE
ncbi:aminotransferase class I/II-fold pyridoxal phosphate-dependent enzyme [candidate division KSB1 bacterium]|nr:aminotransferase class I/II-fold pyridoxal phosphate-dependent enzyme [candidate division KSB1 bacterium]